MQAFVAFVAGLLFSVGLGLGGMMQPERVTGFLDFFGRWDPTLAFVMGTALLVYGIAYFAVARRRQAAYLGPRFAVPTNRNITGRLVAGAAIFGAGWGLIGYCPAPALASAVTGEPSLFVFLAAMFAGMQIHTAFERARERRLSGEVAGA